MRRKSGLSKPNENARNGNVVNRLNARMLNIQQRDVKLANKLTPNNSSGRKARPQLGRLGRRLAENKQSVSELHANSEMQRNKRRNQTNLLRVERAIKQQLKRVGCYDGRIDEDWQTEPVRAAVQKFARLARLPAPPVEPTIELLDAIRARSERICPLECGRRQFEKDGRCIAKKCLAGFELDDDGDCVLRRRHRHEANEDGDHPKVRSYETKQRARAGSEQDPHYKETIVTPTRHVACGPNGRSEERRVG